MWCSDAALGCPLLPFCCLVLLSSLGTAPSILCTNGDPSCRQASGPAIRVGVKAALAEAVTRPTDERVHAAGALLAEAVTGVSHGLHSRAAAVLGPVLREGVLRPDDFKSAKVGECCNAEFCLSCVLRRPSCVLWCRQACIAVPPNRPSPPILSLFAEPSGWEAGAGGNSGARGCRPVRLH